jgi:hypothetical protein
MERVIVSIVVGLCWIAPAQAQTSVLDFSKPMTGKSRYVVNADGTAADMGAADLGANGLSASPPAHRPGPLSSAPAHPHHAHSAHSTPGVTLMSTSSNGYSMGPSSYQVRGYTRPDGTYTAPYLRTAPYPR